MFKKLMFTMMFETQEDVFYGVDELVQKYKANGIDVIPISEIEQVYSEAVKKSSGKDSIVNRMLLNGKGD